MKEYIDIKNDYKRNPMECLQSILKNFKNLAKKPKKLKEMIDNKKFKSFKKRETELVEEIKELEIKLEHAESKTSQHLHNGANARYTTDFSIATENIRFKKENLQFKLNSIRQKIKKIN